MQRALAVWAAGAAVTVAAGQATDFNVLLATPPTQDLNQYQLQGAVSVLISAGNVFYDADNDSIPLQAFEITDQEGNPLGPFMMPTSNYQEYIVDLSSLNTGQGLKPYHRGVELTSASDRGWRLDWYKDGISGAPYSTVLSGPITMVSPNVYTLQVDLQLRWSEEGDSLNRLGQGQYSHIALALADFNSFTLTVETLGAARMQANLFTTTTTTASPTSASPTAPTTPSPMTTPPTVATTDGPVDRNGDDVSYESCMEEARIAEEARVAQEEQYRGESNDWNSPKKAKSVKVPKQDREFCEQFRSDDDCDHGKGKSKKKGKKCKKHKKGKMGIASVGMNEMVAQSTVVIAAVAGLVLVAGYVKVIQQRRAMGDYEALEDKVDPNPVAPTELQAFGAHNPTDLHEQAKTFHLPPANVRGQLTI
eukprot:m.173101 g.173101  ORF g.173101 m.173101 type:complete len:421 (+) comp13640_c0_seq1:213-1475(+)